MCSMLSHPHPVQLSQPACHTCELFTTDAHGPYPLRTCRANVGLSQVQQVVLTNVTTEHGPNDVLAWQYLFAVYELPEDIRREVGVWRRY
jgi:hypothetical protein